MSQLQRSPSCATTARPSPRLLGLLSDRISRGVFCKRTLWESFQSFQEVMVFSNYSPLVHLLLYQVFQQKQQTHTHQSPSQPPISCPFILTTGMPRAELGASPPEALRLGIEDTSRFPYRLYRLLCLPILLWSTVVVRFIHLVGADGIACRVSRGFLISCEDPPSVLFVSLFIDLVPRYAIAICDVLIPR